MRLPLPGCSAAFSSVPQPARWEAATPQSGRQPPHSDRPQPVSASGEGGDGSKNRSGLAWRFATAGVLVPVLLASIFWLPPWSLLVLCGLACLAAGWEALGILAPVPAVIDRTERCFGTFLTVAVGLGAVVVLLHKPLALVGAFPAVFLATMVLLVLRPRSVDSFAHRAAALCFAPLYVGLGLAVYPALRYLAVDGDRWIVLIMTLTFFGDTAAYFVGRLAGRRKLHPRLSPKKTWEGSVGGVVGSAIALLLAQLWYLPQVAWVDVIVLAVVAGGIGQMGDLFESALKRSVGVKDSGALLPGHGGLLDRVDALLPTGLVVVAWGLARGLLRPLGG